MELESRLRATEERELGNHYVSAISDAIPGGERQISPGDEDEVGNLGSVKKNDGYLLTVLNSL